MLTTLTSLVQCWGLNFKWHTMMTSAPRGRRGHVGWGGREKEKTGREWERWVRISKPPRKEKETKFLGHVTRTWVAESGERVAWEWDPQRPRIDSKVIHVSLFLVSSDELLILHHKNKNNFISLLKKMGKGKPYLPVRSEEDTYYHFTAHQHCNLFTPKSNKYCFNNVAALFKVLFRVT